MIDFGLEDNNDLKVEDNIYVEQSDNETTLINAYFTNARVDGRQGYWLELEDSELWTFYQARLDENTAIELDAVAKSTAKILENQGLFAKIEASVYIDEVMTLELKCFDTQNKTVVHRKFAI